MDAPGTSRSVASIVAVTILLAACNNDTAQPVLPSEVRITIVEPRDASNVVEFPGRVQAVRAAEVRARVDGIVKRRLYEEGTDVSAGQELFLIDPREMQASVSAAEAALQRAEATQANAKQDIERYEGLLADNAISEQEFDAAVARLRTDRADVAQARAQLEHAQLNLSYTRVIAPIAGRVGRAQVTEGALVSRAAATLLTRIEQLDPVYVNFSETSAGLLKVQRQVASGELEVPEPNRIGVSVEFEDGSAYTYKGHINFFDMSIDDSTGTVALRAEIPNPDRLLLPGQFVQVRSDAVRSGR